MSDKNQPYALVVDDDPIIRIDAAQILEDAGFNTYESCSVEDAVTILEEYADNVQLLFTDVQMPPSERTGFELARITAERWPHISIIVASGHAKPKEGDMPEGACFIGKPFSARVVHDHLQEILPDEKKPEPLIAQTR